uniref:Uncharacterized protein n=1 Tax=Chrysemys picta bellii TaxID=8478 RepID=A0A8C3IH24_CHRPI
SCWLCPLTSPQAQHLKMLDTCLFNCYNNCLLNLFQDDVRQKVHLSTFGFFKSGFMMVNVSNLSLEGPWSLDDKSNSAVSDFLVERIISVSVSLCVFDTTV